MYLPLLGALGVALMTLLGKEKYATWTWLCALLILLLTFLVHVTKPLDLIF
jgi:hypothetical protein